MRLDVYLCERAICSSRTEAKRLILAGKVCVDGRTIEKCAHDISDDACVTVAQSDNPYVSRGGLKLEAALKHFDLDVRGRSALDVGASSGGFTDCLLRHGVDHVIAVDSGSGQLADALRSDARVSVVEHYNARYMQPQDLAYVPTLAVMDVSFISATLILPSLYHVLADRADLIVLVKPQFEVGRNAVGKGGIVKDARARQAALQKVADAACAIGFVKVAHMDSPILGGDGNAEYLLHLRKEAESAPPSKKGDDA